MSGDKKYIVRDEDTKKQVGKAHGSVSEANAARQQVLQEGPGQPNRKLQVKELLEE